MGSDYPHLQYLCATDVGGQALVVADTYADTTCWHRLRSFGDDGSRSLLRQEQGMGLGSPILPGFYWMADDRLWRS